MGKKYIVEEVDNNGGGCLSVIGLITVIVVALLFCAALAK